MAGFDTLFENIIEGTFINVTCRFFHEHSDLYFSKVQSKILKHRKDPFTNLQSIDLSFNELTKIDASVIKYPNIKSLYLHGNAIENFNEIKKLKTMNNLRRLTLHGNPIGNILPFYLGEKKTNFFQIRSPNIEPVLSTCYQV